MTSFFFFKRAIVPVAVALSAAVSGWAAPAGNDPYAGQYDVLTTPEYAKNAYRQGELIVKLRTENVSTPIRLKGAKGKVRANASAVALNSLLTKYGLEEAEELMPLTGSMVTPKPRRAKSLNGSEMPDCDLSSLYVLRFDPEKVADIRVMADEFARLDDVDYAEPNYIVYACSAGTAADYTADPMYSQQWGIPAINLDKLWDKPIINTKRPVIAILDTGVDIDHPDLAANIWTNEFEANGAEGWDDDNNGFLDDVHGWDFVNQSPRMRDNNGHGTHCAGIAAAVGGNGVGITGANPDALIMPITVMQSDGTGDIGTIIRGIDYAVANGADVLSMSLGHGGSSMAERDALAKAYQKSILVAAAGNEGKSIQQLQSFPAAYNFVLGVMAAEPNGKRANFSNYDEDGPLACAGFSKEELYNYEILAPGVNIMSTYPGGGYKQLNGTSMACPLVAGAISRLYQCKDIPSKEVLFGDLIHTLNGGLFGILDVEATYNLTDANRKPTLAMVSYRLDDSLGDGDLRSDAGEIIDIYPTIRNYYGQAKNIKLKLSLANDLEDSEIVEFITPEVDFGWQLGSYALNESANPLRLKINDNCADGRHIQLRITASCDNISEDVQQSFTLLVENGIEIGGLISEDMTLYPDKHYIVTRMLGVPEGRTLTIMPGTVLKFHDLTGINVKGTINAIGTPENRITFTKGDQSDGQISDFYLKGNFQYCIFERLNIGRYSPNKIIDVEGKKLIFRNSSSLYIGIHGNTEGNLIYNNTSMHGSLAWIKSTVIRNSPYLDFANLATVDISSEGYSGNYFGQFLDKNNKRFYYSISAGRGSEGGKLVDLHEGIYLGSNSPSILRDWIWDINNPYNLNSPGFNSTNQLNISNRLSRPNYEAPGCVWKVVVDGYDAQDEFDKLPALGVGRHKFEVYFSKQMNREATPMVAMGVQPPYTQVVIAEDAQWRTEVFDGDSIDVYTAFLTIHGRDSYDGLNRIYVEGAEDLEYFPCPIEDFRFNVNVQSAGAMSTGFMAEAGAGKVTLTWENPEENFDDMLGYNLYRYVLDDNKMAGDPIRINEQLLNTEEFVDYDIVPGTTYNYYYKVLRTSLDENAPSKVVSATPRAAGKGDANASGNVDVADVVTEVNYMVGRDPKPFIFDAADVNDDKDIDILDVVGTVNIIMAPVAASDVASVASVATYTIVDGILYVDSPVELAGVQAELSGARGSTEISVLDALRGMENTGDWVSDESYRFIAFSLSGKTLDNGRHALLSIGDASLSNLILVDTAGNRVMAIDGSMSGIGDAVMQQMKRPTPNPFVDVINVPVIIGTDGNHAVELSMHNLSGVKVLNHRITLGYGEHNVMLNGSALNSGFYMLTLTVDGSAVQTHKVIKK